MDPALALARLSNMVAAENDPKLDEGTVTDLLEWCRVVDSKGRTLTDPDYVPTFSLNWGASEGWRMKAGIAAERYKFQADGATFVRDQVFTHCLKMADVYDKRANSEPKVIRSRGALITDRLASSTYPFWYDEVYGN